VRGGARGDTSRLDGDLPHCLASLSASTQDKPTTYGDQKQRDPLAVSRLLWLIVALGTRRVKGSQASGRYWVNGGDLLRTQDCGGQLILAMQPAHQPHSDLHQMPRYAAVTTIEL
jgi:hypothetical protein